MKYLTQESFKGLPDDFKSIAVDMNGEAWGRNVPKNKLIQGHGRHFECFVKNTYEVFVGSGYDTTNWQNSAIDRE